MPGDRLVYTDDPAVLVSMAREKGLSDQQIVNLLTRAAPNHDAIREAAEKYAEHLGVTPVEFVRMAGPRSL